MRGPDRIFSSIAPLVEKSASAEIEVVYHHRDLGLTRFAQNVIHQNSRSLETSLSIRVALRGRVGVFTTNRFDQDSLTHALTQATEIARARKKDPDFKGLPRGGGLNDTLSYYESTGRCTPEERAIYVGRVIENCKKNKLQASGRISNTTREFAVANSRGIRAYQLSTSAELCFVPSRGKLSGYEYWAGNDVYALPLSRICECCMPFLSSRRKTIELKPGEYTLFLDYPAVSAIVSKLAIAGFGARSVQDNASFVCGRLGKKIVDNKISLWDDGQDPNGLLRAFDYEGVRKKQVILIKNGICRRVVFDSYTAGREKGRRNTGHALPPHDGRGPLPSNLFMQGGKTSYDELFASLDKAVYIPRLQNIDLLDPRTATVAVSTGSGVLQIENGTPVRPVENLHFTASLLDLLSHVAGISHEVKLSPGSLAPVCTPAMVIDRFNLRGALLNG